MITSCFFCCCNGNDHVNVCLSSSSSSLWLQRQEVAVDLKKIPFKFKETMFVLISGC